MLPQIVHYYSLCGILYQQAVNQVLQLRRPFRVLRGSNNGVKEIQAAYADDLRLFLDDFHEIDRVLDVERQAACEHAVERHTLTISAASIQTWINTAHPEPTGLLPCREHRAVWLRVRSVSCVLLEMAAAQLTGKTLRTEKSRTSSRFLDSVISLANKHLRNTKIAQLDRLFVTRKQDVVRLHLHFISRQSCSSKIDDM